MRDMFVVGSFLFDDHALQALHAQIDTDDALVDGIGHKASIEVEDVREARAFIRTRIHSFITRQREAAQRGIPTPFTAFFASGSAPTIGNEKAADEVGEGENGGPHLLLDALNDYSQE